MKQSISAFSLVLASAALAMTIAAAPASAASDQAAVEVLDVNPQYLQGVGSVLVLNLSAPVPEASELNSQIAAAANYLVDGDPGGTIAITRIHFLANPSGRTRRDRVVLELSDTGSRSGTIRVLDMAAGQDSLKGGLFYWETAPSPVPAGNQAQDQAQWDALIQKARTEGAPGVGTSLLMIEGQAPRWSTIDYFLTVGKNVHLDDAQLPAGTDGSEPANEERARLAFIQLDVVNLLTKEFFVTQLEMLTDIKGQKLILAVRRKTAIKDQQQTLVEDAVLDVTDSDVLAEFAQLKLYWLQNSARATRPSSQ